MLEVIADLRQPAMGGDSSQLQATLSEDSQMANLSLLDIKSDPDTLLRCVVCVCVCVCVCMHMSSQYSFVYIHVHSSCTVS